MRPPCDATAGQSLYFKVRCYKFLSHSILSHLHRKIVYPSTSHPVLKRFPSISLCTGHFLLNIALHACFYCSHDHLENLNFIPCNQLQIYLESPQFLLLLDYVFLQPIKCLKTHYFLKLVLFTEYFSSETWLCRCYKLV